MSNINKIRSIFRRFLNTEPDKTSPEGLALLGIAALLDSSKIITNTMAQDVKQFHEKYDIQYEGKPRMLPEYISKFRVARTREELTEYVDAVNIPDKLDALIDAIYINLGTLHLHGFSPEVIAEAWRRVHEANMKKVLASEKNPSKYGINNDTVKPDGWVSPTHEDLCK